MNKTKTIFYSIIALLLTLTSCDPAATKVEAELPLPTLSTTEPIYITDTTAISGGVIKSDGETQIIARGVCWATTNPTIANAHSTNGTDIGSFNVRITGLFANTTYYVRAYATTKNGTAYGSVYQITTTPIVLDVDGNVYHAVIIGTQTWLIENLKTTRYRNGDSIGTTYPATKDIYYEATPKYQWAYNGDETNAAKYGRLYTWYAVTDSRNIAPIGWHIPTDAEWKTLETYVSTHLGTSISVSKALASTTNWAKSPFSGHTGNNISCNNYTGFSALPGGDGGGSGTFGWLGYYSFWWSSTAASFSTTSAYCTSLSSDDSYVGGGWSDKSNGFSVRCVRDSN